jgi:hypothetical protein
MFDTTGNKCADAYDALISSELDTSDTLNNIVFLNSHLLNEGITKNELGEIGMTILDMRIDTELAIDKINEIIAQQHMLLLAVKQMETMIRDLLPAFNIDYEKYKADLVERNTLVIDYSEMISDDDEE